MTIKEELKKTSEKLKTERDELRVKLHLFKAEAKDEWRDLEGKWDDFRDKEREVLHATGEVGEDVFEAVKLLGSEIKDGFKRIRKSL